MSVIIQIMMYEYTEIQTNDTRNVSKYKSWNLSPCQSGIVILHAKYTGLKK